MALSGFDAISVDPAPKPEHHPLGTKRRQSSSAGACILFCECRAKYPPDVVTSLSFSLDLSFGHQKPHQTKTKQQDFLLP
jgi:hypothetical protein